VKTPSAAAMPDWGRFKPAWRISKLELQEPFGWQVLNEDTLHYLREKLRHFESMTLNEIFVVGRKFNHSVPVTELCAEAKNRLGELKLFDVEELHRLRISGTERIWGILSQNVIELIWWDPDHKVCPVALKNT
jgi:hypothetical protein